MIENEDVIVPEETIVATPEELDAAVEELEDEEVLED